MRISIDVPDELATALRSRANGSVRAYVLQLLARECGIAVEQKPWGGLRKYQVKHLALLEQTQQVQVTQDA